MVAAVPGDRDHSQDGTRATRICLASLIPASPIGEASTFAW
jgi:hypothetical protein